MKYGKKEKVDANTVSLFEKYISNICDTDDSYSEKSALLIESLFNYKFESIDDYIEYYYSYIDSQLITAKHAQENIERINSFLKYIKTNLNKFQFDNDAIKHSINVIKKEYKITAQDERSLIIIHELAQCKSNIDLWSCYDNTSELMDNLRLFYNLKIIESKTTTFLAIMRTVVIDLLDELDDYINDNKLQPIGLINTTHRISEIIYLMRACNLTTEEDFVKKIHSICARMQRNKQEKQKYENETILAEHAWKIGCNLLHSQMNLLLKDIFKNNNKDFSTLSAKLKKIAPEKLVFGKGGKKVISSCPCELKNECEIAKMLPNHQVIDLPTSKKGVRKPKRIFNVNSFDSCK